jgi:hypothetical protein
MSNKTAILDYFLITLVFLFTVTVYFESMELPLPRMTNIIPLIILALLYINKIGKIEISFIVVVFFVIALIYIQGYLFGYSFLSSITYPLFVFVIPYLLYKVVGYRVFKYLVNIIYYTAIIAAVIWLLQVLYSPFNDFLQIIRLNSDHILVKGTEDRRRVSIAFIYTITNFTSDVLGVKILRNSGLYHEPGAFAYFIIIAIGINTITQHSYLNRKNIIMTIIMFTTFSTAGYLSLFVLMAYAVVNSNISVIIKIIAIPVFLVSTYVSFQKLEFMQDKIGYHYETQIDDKDGYSGAGGRFGRIRSSINLLSTSPVLGRGIITASREYNIGSPYYFPGAGLWRTLSSYGLLFAPVIYLLFYWGVRNLCIGYDYTRGYAIVLFISIAIGATSQQFFMDNVTMLFFMNGLLTFNKYDDRVIINIENYQRS